MRRHTEAYVSRTRQHKGGGGGGGGGVGELFL